jgi:sugar/nucleoside kinase (ribokinase family)
VSLLVVGTVAYDSVKTPAGSRSDAFGGSAAYFSIAASYFARVGIVAVVGDDFRESDRRLLRSRGVDTSGLEVAEGKTFRWSGVYGAEGVGSRETLDTQLNVFARFSPKLDPQGRRQPYLFLANADPCIQMDVLAQMERRPRLVALDSMNFWIEGKREQLTEAIRAVDAVFVDEGEARAFAGEANLVRAAKRILALGPSTVVVKRGEHGALLIRRSLMFAAPAFPLEAVVDPTGAGDSFAGGFMGYLAATGDLSDDGYRRAAAVGSVMGSYAVESFSADRLSGLRHDEIDERFRAFTRLTRMKALRDGESLPAPAARSARAVP